MTEARRHDALAITFLALIGTLLFVDVFVGTHNFFIRDLTRYYYPTKKAIREIVLNGEFPYWNRQFAAGQPIAANPEHEVFYPLNWLLLLPDYDFGYRLHILLHVYIGLIAMYALLRSMDIRAPSAFLGAVAFGIGGVYMSYINLLPILFCAAWLPLTCLYVRRFLLAPRLRDFALASFFLGIQFLIGEPTTVLQTGFLIGMYALYRGWYAAADHDLGWKYAIPEMLTRVAMIAAISVSAIAVGAAQMIPAIDHVADSARSRVFDFSLVSAWSMPWAKFAEFIYPNFLGYMSVDHVTWYWAGGLYPGMGSPFIFSVYSGLLVTALGAAAIFVRPRGGRFVLLLCTFSVLIALGGHTPLLRFLYEAGIATSIRYPEKFILIAVFALILFTSQLLDRMLGGDEAIREGAMGFVAATTVVAIAVSLLGLTPYYEQVFEHTWGLKGGLGDRMTDLSHGAWVIAAARGLVLFGILWLMRRLHRRVVLGLLVAFVLADLIPVVHQLNPRMPAHFFRSPPPALRHLQAGNRDQYRVFHEVDWHGQEPIARKYFGTGPAVYWIVRNGIFPMTPAGHGLSMVMERDYDKTALLPTIDFVESVWDIKRTGRVEWWDLPMRMSNAWYRSAYKPFEEEKKRVNGKMEVAEPVEFQPGPRHPRYYFADQMVPIRSRHDFVKYISASRYSPNVAFVMGAGFPVDRAVVHSWRETANTAVIDVESFGNAFLVMSVTPHKYWRITIDGRETKAHSTNVGYQGVVVPRGRHRVEMRYRNHLAANGAKISIAASVVLLGLAFVTPRRRRVSGGPPHIQ